MTDDILTRAEKACEGVTEGPWEAVETASGGEWWVELPHRATICESHSGRDVNPFDAEFIAAARTLMPEMAAALAAERAETTRLRAAVERVRAVHRRGIYTATGNAFCYGCEDEYGRKAWPCPTIAALDEPGDEQ